MSWETVNRSIESHFGSSWSSTPVAWRNVVFDNADIPEWVRLSVLPGDTVQASMGADTNVYRSHGSVVVQVFTEFNNGQSRALVLADQVLALFRGLVLDGILFDLAQLSIQGESGGWFQVNITCNFYTDDLI